VAHAKAFWNEPGHPGWYTTSFDSHEAAVGRIVSVANVDEFPRARYTSVPQAQAALAPAPQLPQRPPVQEAAIAGSSAAAGAAQPLVPSPAISERGGASTDTESLGTSPPLAAAALQKRRQSRGASLPSLESRVQKRSRSEPSGGRAAGVQVERGVGAVAGGLGDQTVEMQQAQIQQLQATLRRSPQMALEEMLAVQQQLPPALQQLLQQARELQRAQLAQGQPQQLAPAVPHPEQGGAGGSQQEAEVQAGGAGGRSEGAEWQSPREGGAGGAFGLDEARFREGRR
jgi:hypothetical protein